MDFFVPTFGIKVIQDGMLTSSIVTPPPKSTSFVLSAAASDGPAAIAAQYKSMARLLRVNEDERLFVMRIRLLLRLTFQQGFDFGCV